VKIIDFIFAGRPTLLLPTWSIYLITYKLMPYDIKFTYDGFSILIGITLITIGAYFINQIYDYESDKLNNKLGFLQRGIIKRGEMMAAYIVTSLLPLAPGFKADFKIGILMTIMILLGYIYSAPPLRLKDRPIIGLLANATAYGVLVPLAVPRFMNVIDISRVYILLCFFSMVAAAFLLTIIPDREGDRVSGKLTLATRFSNRQIIVHALIFLAVSLYASFIINNIFLIIICTISIVLFLIAFISNEKKSILFACKFPILLLSLLAGYYFPTYLVFLLVLLILTRIYYKKRFGIVYPRLN
jgi:4-hydroxybenzoate polyprenyltransferase